MLTLSAFLWLSGLTLQSFSRGWQGEIMTQQQHPDVFTDKNMMFTVRVTFSSFLRRLLTCSSI